MPESIDHITVPPTTPKRTRRSPQFVALAEQADGNLSQVAAGKSVKACKAALQAHIESGAVTLEDAKLVWFVCIHETSTPKVSRQIAIKW